MNRTLSMKLQKKPWIMRSFCILESWRATHWKQDRWSNSFKGCPRLWPDRTKGNSDCPSLDASTATCIPCCPKSRPHTPESKCPFNAGPGTDVHDNKLQKAWKARRKANQQALLSSSRLPTPNVFLEMHCFDDTKLSASNHHSHLLDLSLWSQSKRILFSFP